MILLLLALLFDALIFERPREESHWCCRRQGHSLWCRILNSTLGGRWIVSEMEG
jgi:hypothetical protein